MSIVKQAFSLKDIEYRILQHFAIDGESSRQKIAVKTTIYSPHYGEKQLVRYIEGLIKKDFLRLSKKKKIKNLKSKSEKFYVLTFRGFLASLCYCKLEKNSIMIKFLENISDKRSKKKILDYIKSEIDYFLIWHIMKKIPLDGMSKLERWVSEIQRISLDNFEDDEGEELQELKKECGKKYLKIDNIYRDEMYLKTEDYNQDLFLYIEYWQYGIGGICKGWNYDKIINILWKMKKESDSLSLETTLKLLRSKNS